MKEVHEPEDAVAAGVALKLVVLRSLGTNLILAWLREMDSLRQAGIAA